MSSTSKNNNEVITFYSYKGGNGRTMALSNVATLLAQQNSENKILMIDWDLEAPGLHRFFFQDSLFTSFTKEKIKEIYKNVEERPGLIDLFITLKNIIDEYDDVIDDTTAIHILDQIKFNDFIISTSVNNLYILKAGRFDRHYSDKVNIFNWETLYTKAPSLISLLTEKLAKEYKYILIDSRTGFTDISGICTMLMPQKLVVVFTPNRQSYTGISDLIRKATTYRGQSEDMRPLLVYPLPSRIEFSRDDLRANWRYGNDQKGITGYQKIFQDIFKEVYGLDNCNLTEYFEQVQIQQSPNYAYGEEIAILSEKTKDSFSLSKSYENFTQWLVDSNAPWQSKRSEESSNVDISAAIDFDTLGLQFEKKGQYEKALSYYNRSLAIYEELDHKEGLVQLHNKIATLLKNMKSFDDALKHFGKALEIHKNARDQLSVARDYTNIAEIFEHQSKYDDALKCCDDALKAYPNFTEALKTKRIMETKLNEMSNQVSTKIPNEMSTNNNLRQQYHQIFISYAHEDSNYAHRLFRDLKEFEKEDNAKFWLDKDSLLPGQNWSNEIQNVINESKYFIVLLSKNAIEKNTYVQEELRLALEIADKQQVQISIIPVRLDNCEFIEPIQKLHVVDLFPDWKYGFEKILLAMGISPKPKKLTDITWLNLLSAIDRKNCIPFIGSSALEFFNKVDDEAFLTNDELAREWAEKYDYPFEAPYQLPKVAQYVAISELGNEMDAKINICSRFRKMKPPNFLSDKYNRSPHAILAELDLPIYITTNYDFFMEEALKNRGRQPKSEICKWNDELREIVDEGTKHDPYKPTPEEPLVFHFFGNLDYPESMVLTERDHQEFVINTNNRENKDMIPTFLRRSLPNSTLLFIGYSLEDINFLSLFHGGLSFMSSVRQRKNSILVLKISDTEDSVLREKVSKYMEKYTNHMFEIVIYWGEPNDFIEELQTKWQQFKQEF